MLTVIDCPKFAVANRHIFKVANRAVGRTENPGVPVLFGGHNLPPLVEIELTYLPNLGVPGTPLGKAVRANLFYIVTLALVWVDPDFAKSLKCFKKASFAPNHVH